MTSLDRFMEYFVAAVFLLVGLRRLSAYRRRPRALGAASARLPLGLPSGSTVMIGLFEIVAALALITPFGVWPQGNVVRLAATGLALLMLVSGIYQVRRRESVEPTAVLFLLALFVIVGRSI